eukprot:gb/GECG01011453.1/.p1 GENE.gb/GECG01011453.1/~~gb/GECG01011453.1/.p1  ORF type:complete len:513 (+),score=135.87 gb/GECG01011453.1/:1-1539(+)
MANKRRRTEDYASSNAGGEASAASHTNGGHTGDQNGASAAAPAPDGGSSANGGGTAYQFMPEYNPSSSVPDLPDKAKMEELKEQRKKHVQETQSREEEKKREKYKMFDEEHDKFEAAELFERGGGGNSAAAAASGASRTGNVHEQTVMTEEELQEESDDDVDEDGADISDLPKAEREKWKAKSGTPQEDADDSEEEEEQKKQKKKVPKLQHVQGERDDYDYRVEDGTVFEPFNLKEERKTGYFDETGNYVRLQEKDNTASDPWLQEIDEAERTGKLALPPVDLSKNQQEDAEQEAAAPDFVTLLSTCVNVLKDGESVSEGMRRLRIESTSKGSNFDNLVESADELVGLGHMEVYNYTKEHLQQQLQNARVASGVTGTLASETSAENREQRSEAQQQSNFDEDSILWEYKWTKDSDETFGPFPSMQMYEWAKQGMFNFDGYNTGFEVWARRVPNPKAKKSQSTGESLLSDLDDDEDTGSVGQAPMPSTDQANTIKSDWVRAKDVDFRQYAAME